MYENRKPQASFSVERRTKKRKLDRLTRDCLAAEAAGMSYGKYKALHPHTGEEDRLPIVGSGSYECTCACCGRTFYKEVNNAKKYCTDECRQKAKRQRIAARKGNPQPAEKTCPICGKTFKPLHGYTQKYCGKDCYTEGQRENARKLRAKYREEAAKNGSI